MSLIFRQRAQPMLDEYGMANYHAIVDPDTKYVQIVGECGKPLVNIRDISFSRTTPGKEELAYSLELLHEYILKHQVQINKYLDKLVEFKKLPMPDEESDLGTTSPVTKHSYREGRAHNEFTGTFNHNFYDGPFYYIIDPDYPMSGRDPEEAISGVACHRTPTPWEEIRDYKFDVEKFKKSMEKRQHYAAWYMAKLRLDREFTELNTCSI